MTSDDRYIQAKKILPEISFNIFFSNLEDLNKLMVKFFEM